MYHSRLRHRGLVAALQIATAHFLERLVLFVTQKVSQWPLSLVHQATGNQGSSIAAAAASVAATAAAVVAADAAAATASPLKCQRWTHYSQCQPVVLAHQQAMQIEYVALPCAMLAAFHCSGSNWTAAAAALSAAAANAYLTVEMCTVVGQA